MVSVSPSPILRRDMSKTRDKCIGCGPGWLNIGPRDIYYPCCIPHDQGYKESAQIYAEGILQNSVEKKLQGVQLKQLSDHQFFSCLKENTAKRSFFVRHFYNIVGVFYTGSIITYSNNVWANLVLADIPVRSAPT